MCEKHAKFWHNFNGKLAKTAFHLPRERMQLKVPSKKTKVFFDFEANSVGVLAKYSARLREIHSSSPGEPIEEQIVFWRKKIFLNIFKLRAWIFWTSDKQFPACMPKLQSMYLRIIFEDKHIFFLQKVVLKRFKKFSDENVRTLSRFHGRLVKIAFYVCRDSFRGEQDCQKNQFHRFIRIRHVCQNCILFFWGKPIFLKQ